MKTDPCGWPLTTPSRTATCRADAAAANCATSSSAVAGPGPVQASAEAIAAAIALLRARRGDVDRDGLICIVLSDQTEYLRVLCCLGQVNRKRGLRENDDSGELMDDFSTLLQPNFAQSKVAAAAIGGD